jgi:hypothetical protein
MPNPGVGERRAEAKAEAKAKTNAKTKAEAGPSAPLKSAALP